MRSIVLHLQEAASFAVIPRGERQCGRRQASSVSRWIPLRAVPEPDDDQLHLRILRLRVPGASRPVHVARQPGTNEQNAPWSGAERMLVAGGRVVGAFSRSRLVREYQSTGGVAAVWPKVLVLDLRRCRRRLERSESRWSSEMRGTLADVDDLLWDSAYSLGDRVAGDAIKNPNAFHAEYEYVWGNRSEPLPPAERVALWDELLGWFLARLDVVDRHEPRYLRRR